MSRTKDAEKLAAVAEQERLTAKWQAMSYAEKEMIRAGEMADERSEYRRDVANGLNWIDHELSAGVEGINLTWGVGEMLDTYRDAFDRGSNLIPWLRWRDLSNLSKFDVITGVIEYHWRKGV